MKIEALRTPDERFEHLPGYDFAPHYAMVEGDLRMHYVDENAGAERVVVLLHGEPSWSYLYRKMIPPLAEAGFRVIAPDLIGFGKSDKPVKMGDYTFGRHLNWVKQLLFEHLDLNRINFFIQDWGGLLGLRIIAEHPDRIETVTAGNTFLPTGDQPLGEAFDQWKAFSQKVNPFMVGRIIQKATVSELSPEIIAAYDAPFPDEIYKAGARIFPALVPSTPTDPESEPNRKAWQELMKFDKPFLTLFSDQDPIMRGLDKLFHKLIPGTQGQPHSTIGGGGHFLQEDKGGEIAEKMIAFLNP